MKYALYAILVSTVLSVSCKNDTLLKKEVAHNNENGIDWTLAQNYYLQHIANATTYLKELDSLPMTGDATKALFKKVRIEFKKAEPYASYLNPTVGHKANGPALPVCYLPLDYRK